MWSRPPLRCESSSRSRQQRLSRVWVPPHLAEWRPAGGHLVGSGQGEAVALVQHPAALGARLQVRGNPLVVASLEHRREQGRAEATPLAAWFHSQVVQVPVTRVEGWWRSIRSRVQAASGSRKPKTAAIGRAWRRVRRSGTRQRPGAAHTAAPLPSLVIQTWRCSGVRLPISAVKKASSRSVRLLASGSRCAQAGSAAKAKASASAAASWSSGVAGRTCGFDSISEVTLDGALTPRAGGLWRWCRPPRSGLAAQRGRGGAHSGHPAGRR